MLAKYNFIPETQLGFQEESAFKVSITKQGHIYFPSTYVDAYDLHKKCIKLYGDPVKHTIGWTIIDSGSLSDLQKTRKISKVQKGGILTIKKLLIATGFDFSTTKQYDVEK